MYDNQIKTAEKQANIAFYGALFMAFTCGVLAGALYSNQIFQFINYLIN